MSRPASSRGPHRALRRSAAAAILVAAVGCLVAGTRTAAQAPCDGFADTARTERALYTREPVTVRAASRPEDASVVARDARYELTLVPQAGVAFAFAPGKSAPADSAFAGIIRAAIDHAGRYRVSLSTKAWIDVIADGASVPSVAYRALPDCRAPHKIVEFDLPPGPVLIQLSAAPADHLTLTLTEAPPPPN